MTGYIEPDYRPEELVDARACFARAQSILERAEQNVDRIITEFNGELNPEQAARVVEAEARIGQGWAELGRALGGAR